MTTPATGHAAPSTWAHPTMLAPMEGVSHPLFRQIIAERGGLGVVCTEFVRVADGPLAPSVVQREVVKVAGVPLCVQVMGNAAEHMADSAAAVAKAGADIVDINLGCPAPRAVRKGVGSAMLQDPGLLYDVLSAMRQAIDVTLSAKIRAGFDDNDGVLHIAETIQRAGADYLVIHPRRRSDFYAGVADWRIIARLKAHLDIPVIGNGDCWYAADALRLERETGCDAVMIGRPALRNPWIFRQIAELRADEPAFSPTGADLAAFVDEMVTRYEAVDWRSSKGSVGKVKELITYLGRAVNDGGTYRHRALRLPTVADIVAFTWDTVGPMSADQMDLDPVGTLGLERSGSTLMEPPVPEPTDTWRGPGYTSRPHLPRGREVVTASEDADARAGA